MIDALADRMDDAAESLLAAVLLGVIWLAKAIGYALAFVTPLAMIAGGIVLLAPMWEHGLPVVASVFCGTSLLLLGIRIELEVLIWCRSKVAKVLYLRQLYDNMPESAGGHYQIRHSWCERRGTRHEVVVSEESFRLFSAQVDGTRIDRYYGDWTTAFEDVSVRILTGRMGASGRFALGDE